MKDTKASENNPKGTLTLLHYLALTLEETQKDVLSFMDELKHLDAATRISFVTVVSSVASLDTGFKSIKEEIKILKKIGMSPKNDNFCKVMEV